MPSAASSTSRPMTRTTPRATAWPSPVTGAAGRPPLARALDERADGTGDGDGHGQDNRELEDEAELVGQTPRDPLGLVGDLDGDPETEDEGPEDRGQPDGLGERGPAVRRAGPPAHRRQEEGAKDQRHDRRGDQREARPDDVPHGAPCYRSPRA